MDRNNTIYPKARTNKEYTRWDFFIVAAFVLSCSNLWIMQVEGKFFWVLCAIISLVYMLTHKQRFTEMPSLRKYVFWTLIIFIAQFFIFGWNTFPGIVNFESKIIVGATVYMLLGSKFKYCYLNLMYYLAVIALFFWTLQLQDIYFDWFPVKGSKGFLTSIILFYHRIGEPTRNQGAFGEPGYYGIYLNMVFLLFITCVNEMKKHRFKFIVIAISVLTTQSTTAYICFGAMVMLYFVLFTRKWYIKALAPLAFFGAIIAYESIPFLQEKINDQSSGDTVEDVASGYSSTRFGSAVFNFQLIKKHPIVGNGLHERTLYADYPWLVGLFANNEVAGNGNGLTNQCAKMGLAFYFIFLYLLYKNNKGIKRWEYLSFIAIFFMMAWGEDFFNVSFFLAMPFVRLVRDKDNFKQIKA